MAEQSILTLTFPSREKAAAYNAKLGPGVQGQVENPFWLKSEDGGEVWVIERGSGAL